MKQDQYDIIISGVPKWNAWRLENPTEAVDLSGANLIRANLIRANLSGADLSGAHLIGADLSGWKIPVIPNIDAAILAEVESKNIGFDMGRWHCGSAHCRAGSAIHLAGDAGYALEEQLGPSAAGALIYAASRPNKPVPDFHCPNDVALADLRAGAGVGQ